MVARFLLALCMLSLCSAQESFCARRRMINKLDERWPFFSRGSVMDDRGLHFKYYASDGGHLLEYAPGVDKCGGRYPIWRKELRNNISVVCVENENSTCAHEMEIETHTCEGRETYLLRTHIEDSVFCFQPDFCRFNPCQNGGTCISKRDGPRCRCPTGFSGPSCEGDPCHNYGILPDMDLRSPSNTVPQSYNDTIAPGWYEAPQGWTMAASDPNFACGTEFSLYTQATDGDLMLICESFFPGACFSPSIVQTVTCERNKTLYGLFHLNGLVTYCFECTPYPLDLLIIEDVSTSVIKQDFLKMKNFSLEVVRGLDISPQGTNVAFMSVSKTAQIGFHLNTYANESDVLTAMAAQHGIGGRTVLGDGVKLAASDVFNPSNGDRPDAKNVVLMFTDGRANGGPSIHKTFRLLTSQADVFVVTVTSQVDQVAVRRLSSGYNHYRSIDDKDALTWAKDAVTPCKRYKI